MKSPEDAVVDQVKLHILLVEDQPVTAKMMRAVLNANGHTVQWAGDIAAALGLADRNEFDLLMSDLGLPDGSGHDLMRQLRGAGTSSPAWRSAATARKKTSNGAARRVFPPI